MNYRQKFSNAVRTLVRCTQRALGRLLTLTASLCYFKLQNNKGNLIFTFSGFVRSRTPPLARSSCLAFLKSSPVAPQGGVPALLLPPYCATDSLRFPWLSDSFSSGRPRYFRSLILRSSVRYSDTIPWAYLRYESAASKHKQQICY